MKQVTLSILLLMLTSIGCKKEDKTPSPTTAPTPTATMTATETALVGKWYWDKTENWSGGSLIATYDHTTHPSQAVAYMDLKSSLYFGAVNPAPQKYDNIWLSTGTTTYLNAWKVIPIGLFPKENLETNAPPFSTYGGYIDSISSTNLILIGWSGTVQNGYKNFYHK